MQRNQIKETSYSYPCHQQPQHQLKSKAFWGAEAFYTISNSISESTNIVFQKLWFVFQKVIGYWTRICLLVCFDFLCVCLFVSLFIWLFCLFDARCLTSSRLLNTIRPFWNSIGAFWNTIGPFWNSIGAFWNTIGTFWNTIHPFWNTIGAFWNTNHTIWNTIGTFWNTIRNGVHVHVVRRSSWVVNCIIARKTRRL